MRKVDTAAEDYWLNKTYLSASNQLSVQSFKAGVAFAHSKDVERIVCAAIRYKSDDNELVSIGFSHSSASNPILNMHLEYKTTDGFITSKGRFVDRKEAADIAYNIGQIDEKIDHLTSNIFY